MDLTFYWFPNDCVWFPNDDNYMMHRQKIDAAINSYWLDQKLFRKINALGLISLNFVWAKQIFKMRYIQMPSMYEQINPI